MPLPKLSIKEYYAGDTDEFGLREDEYFTPDAAKSVEGMLGIFGYIGLRPVAYQIGHKFFNVERKQSFIVRTQETLDACLLHIGTRIIWIPSIDEVFKQIYYDDMRLTIANSGRFPNYIYRTYIFDPLFPAELGYQPFRHTSTDPWISVVFPVAKAYRRRFDTYGVDTFRKTIYTTDSEFASNPLTLIDQNPAIITRKRGLRSKENDKQANSMEGKPRE